MTSDSPNSPEVKRFKPPERRICGWELPQKCFHFEAPPLMDNIPILVEKCKTISASGFIKIKLPEGGYQTFMFVLRINIWLSQLCHR